MRSHSAASRAVGALAAAALAGCLSLSCATPVIEIGNPDLSRVRDGRWLGYYDGGMVKVKVAAEVADSRIASVEILLHDCGTGKKAERIVDDIVARQSLDVDVVAGATHSSRCILKATELALMAGSP